LKQKNSGEMNGEITKEIVGVVLLFSNGFLHQLE
jgi:hypothetical protein